jgi:hypothetical protein
MKRRKFVQSLLAAPAVPIVLDGAQIAPPTTAPKQQPQPQAETPARQNSHQPPSVAHLELTEVDLTAEPAPHFFTSAQFANLKKLGAVLLPPLKNNPGALDAQAPEFLDFLISVSPSPRQHSYQFGLDQIETQARGKYQKSFCDLDGGQVDAILRPLMVARPWPEDLPDDPLKGFIAQVHEDLRTATMNSREWAAASEKSGHHFTRGFRGSGYYWFPIDPISQG